ncbi:MAG: NADH-quinone oxidoreductase subunit J [Vicinamibacteria bacterium]|jgi:NADH:ubiquinone oxidoreductase subunit 6 (subunit J)|nr:NADH-quinone oxidoreductase subunit J [Vicinamibacteria bacterium]MBP9948407.1 NADH-quinone oxidoreductase subunit J [Vicinamibacteria bacterium]
MNPEVLGFWILAITLIGSALGVVLTKNLFHSVLWLALGLVSTAGVFLLLDAEFLAAVQVLLYAGGVITVVVFAIVVTEKLVGEKIAHTSKRLLGGGIVAALIFAMIASLISRAGLDIGRPEATAEATRSIGLLLLTKYLLPFELLAVLLLAGLIAASYFARPED